MSSSVSLFYLLMSLCFNEYKYSSAMAERPRDAILKEWVNLRLNFKLKGYGNCGKKPEIVPFHLCCIPRLEN